MTRSLAGKTIALAEGRQLEELAAMLSDEGAAVLRCPLLSIVDAADDGPTLAFLEEMSRLDYLVLLTGEGLRRLLGCAERHGMREPVLVSLRQVKTVTRGPKPVRALKEVGLAPTIVARMPTTAGVIEALGGEALGGKRVGIQLYPNANAELAKFLAAAGAVVRGVEPYVYAPASDAEHVGAMIGKMAAGEVDVIVFTSSPQVDRLFEVARARAIEGQLAEGLRRTTIAAVGPVVKENLLGHGCGVDICPEQGFVMRNLIQHIKKHA